ncbi:MAG: SusC/RagA family TonB-linked outer membrane protein, partial [Cyclobacteriaceae bacterium]|nr:SusC/RagA family TonB-linked outer membrane protein [Cyclobacteriaceae bacterium]
MPESSTLSFSFIGFTNTEVAVGSQTVIDVALDTDVTELSEVVITSFGESKKSSFTGSSTTIGSAQLAKRPVSNLFQSIAGSGPGITTTAGSGQPGSAPDIRIRGFGSISNDNEPLYVVDGVPYTGNLGNLNPDDIEKLTILKDAASTSLYGSRGSNGVVLVTTKKGKAGKTTVNVRYTKGFSDRGLPEYDRIGSGDYYPLMWEADRNSFAYRATSPVPIATASQNASNNLPTLLGYNVYNVPFNQLVDVNGVLNPNAQLLYPERELDWEAPIMRRGNRDEFSLNISGANEKTDYFFSSSYLNDVGYLIRSDFKRFTARLNVNSQVNSWLKTGANFTTTISAAKQADADGSASFVNPFNFSRNMGPIFPIYAFDPANPGSFLLKDGQRFYDYGNMNALGLPNRPVNTGRHVIAETELNTNDARRNIFGGRGYTEFTFLKDFKFTLNAGADVTNLYRPEFQNPEIGDGAPAGRARHRYNYILSTNFNQLLNYNKSFGSHSLSVLLGHESFEVTRNLLDGSRSAQITAGNIELANFTTTTNLNSRQDENSVEGYFSRVNYDFKEKYFASISARRDGSSRFSKDVRWGTFYSVSGAWRIDQEKFMSQISQISTLKLRSSFGQNGNESILDKDDDPDYYPSEPLFAVGSWNNATEAGSLQQSLGNSALSWETADQLDVALEFGLFKNRITGSVEYFSRASRDLIFAVPLPISSGVETVTQNIGRMVNTGIEIELNAQVLNLGGFTWDLG